MWLPYKENWIVDRNKNDDSIEVYYGNLIKELTENSLFQTYYSQDGGMSNYLEFICYPNGYDIYDDNAIVVYVSLCAPIAAYGQIGFHKTIDSWGWSFIKPEQVNIISDNKLIDIENEIKDILKKNKVGLIDREFACRQLLNEVVEELRHENHNEGTQYLHGLFQVTD